MILVKVLIVLLLLLLILYLSGVFIKFFEFLGFRMREGLENMPMEEPSLTYTDPGLNKDPLYLATLNAANISYIKEQIDKLSGLKEQVKELKSQVDNSNTAITEMGQEISAGAQELVGRSPNSTDPIPTATGLE
jgi:hypothetical protein